MRSREGREERERVACSGRQRQFDIDAGTRVGDRGHPLFRRDRKPFRTDEFDVGDAFDLLPQGHGRIRPALGAALQRLLARRLTTLTVAQPIGQRIPWLRNFISVAEFLAREVRSSAAGTAQENPTP